jgi:hypothetical protein
MKGTRSSPRCIRLKANCRPDRQEHLPRNRWLCAVGSVPAVDLRHGGEILPNTGATSLPTLIMPFPQPIGLSRKYPKDAIILSYRGSVIPAQRLKSTLERMTPSMPWFARNRSRRMASPFRGAPVIMSYWLVTEEGSHHAMECYQLCSWPDLPDPKLLPSAGANSEVSPRRQATQQNYEGFA